MNKSENIESEREEELKGVIGSLGSHFMCFLCRDVRFPFLAERERNSVHMKTNAAADIKDLPQQFI